MIEIKKDCVKFETLHSLYNLVNGEKLSDNNINIEFDGGIKNNGAGFISPFVNVSIRIDEQVIKKDTLDSILDLIFSYKN